MTPSEKLAREIADEYWNGLVCLLPARTDTSWFHDYCKQHEVRFLKGRLCFNDAAGRAPFPSMIVVMDAIPKTDSPAPENEPLR